MTVDILGPCDICGEPLSRPGGHAACDVRVLEAEVDHLREALADERQRTRAGVRTPAPGYENAYVSGNVHAAVCQERDRLREAVEHYASESNWVNGQEYKTFPGFHGAAVARAALSETP